MENVLRTIKNDVFEFNKTIAEEIENYKIMIENETDEPAKDLLKKMLCCDQYCYIFNMGIINVVTNITFFKNAFLHLIESETELTELINEQIKQYNVEENCYLQLCKRLKIKYNTLKKFLNMLEDAHLHPEKYNY